VPVGVLEGVATGDCEGVELLGSVVDDGVGWALDSNVSLRST
jgi:hypothetical protein